MANHYKPLRGLRGIQTDYNKFQFSWDSAGNDYQAHFLWVYKEDELDRPYVMKYAQCINNRIQTIFQYNNVSLQEIRRIRFLVFLSDNQMAPSGQELNELSRYPEFLCEVCCGSGEIEWKWIQDQSGVTLGINSNKKIPQGILYYEYLYGNKMFRFHIPGEIRCGENYYRNIYFPGDMAGTPQLRSSEQNVRLSVWNGKNKGSKNGGLLDKLANMIRK